jgi:hypothetical protein
MPLQPRAPSLAAPMFLLFFVCGGGCAGCSEKPKAGSIDSGYTLHQGQSAPFSKPPLLLDGELDLENRYASTVRVKPNASEMLQECSGVFISPHLVLTAAHCVCMPQNARASGNKTMALFDSSTCATAAAVTGVTYLPPLPNEAVSTLNRSHRGVVRPHPSFTLSVDAQGAVESSHADLALIVLGEPATHHFPPVKLADTEAEVSEPVVTVGYGDDESDSGGYDDRRFSKSRVEKPPVSGADFIVLSPPPRPGYQDDSGGPCLRETGGVQVLVGISRRGLGKEPTCTSTHIYKAWLAEELRRAAQSVAPLPP